MGISRIYSGYFSGEGIGVWAGDLGKESTPGFGWGLERIVNPVSAAAGTWSLTLPPIIQHGLEAIHRMGST